MLSGFLLGIKTLGMDAVDETISHLTEYKSLDIHNCPQGERWSDALQRCVKDPQ